MIENGLCKIGKEEYPAVGLGTYRLMGEICREALLAAARCGYRIIDTATFYDNFEAIAEAFKELSREQFHFISKVWHDKQAPEDLRRDLEETLRRLQTDYLDTYLLHWPNHKVPIEATLQAMEELRNEGKIRYIGMSNITAGHLKRALEVGVPIHWAQVEMHPFFCDFELLDLCLKEGIILQSWRPLNFGKAVSDALLAQFGEKAGKSASQVALRWILQHGALPLPGSQNEEHIRENFNIFDFSLSEEQMQKIDERAAKGERFRLDGAGHGFTDEFSFTYEECWPKRL